MNIRIIPVLFSSVVFLFSHSAIGAELMGVWEADTLGDGVTLTIDRLDPAPVAGHQIGARLTFPRPVAPLVVPLRGSINAKGSLQFVGRVEQSEILTGQPGEGTRFSFTGKRSGETITGRLQIRRQTSGEYHKPQWHEVTFRKSEQLTRQHAEKLKALEAEEKQRQEQLELTEKELTALLHSYKDAIAAADFETAATLSVPFGCSRFASCAPYTFTKAALSGNPWGIQHLQQYFVPAITLVKIRQSAEIDGKVYEVAVVRGKDPSGQRVAVFEILFFLVDGQWKITNHWW